MITKLKKNPKAYLELQQEFYDNIRKKNLSAKLCHYVWDVLISMNRRYGFNSAHTLAYSIVGLQEAYLAYHYPVIYWNSANLISDSGGEDGNVNYGKIAKAISNIQKERTKVALPDINRVKFGFRPNVELNEIIYGLKPIQGIGAKLANGIISHQPYASMQDFYNKMQSFKEEALENKFGDMAMIQLIKAGCFDDLEKKPRTEIMADFIRQISSPITSLKMANIEDLNRLGLLTEDQKKFELRLYRFCKYVCQKQFFYKQEKKSPNTAYYYLERKFAEPYFEENFMSEMQITKDYELTDNGLYAVKKGSLDREFNKLTKDFRENVLTSQEMLDAVNKDRFDNLWKEKATGTVSKWEMDSMCFYYGPHELENVNRKEYDIVNFNDMPEEPVIADVYYYRNQQKPRFVLNRICGTVLDKDRTKHTVTLLTPDGVCDVKFYAGAFSYWDKQISQIEADGTKKTLEKSWFSRGNKIMVTGFRRGEQWIAKKYKDSVYNHSVQLIVDIDEKGNLDLKTDRIEVDSANDVAV